MSRILLDAIHATLDDKPGRIATAMTDDDARRRAYACRVMSERYAVKGIPALADLFAARAYRARTRVHRRAW